MRLETPFSTHHTEIVQNHSIVLIQNNKTKEDITGVKGCNVSCAYNSSVSTSACNFMNIPFQSKELHGFLTFRIDKVKP